MRLDGRRCKEDASNEGKECFSEFTEVLNVVGVTDIVFREVKGIVFFVTDLKESSRSILVPEIDIEKFIDSCFERVRNSIIFTSLDVQLDEV